MSVHSAGAPHAPTGRLRKMRRTIATTVTSTLIASAAIVGFAAPAQAAGNAVPSVGIDVGSGFVGSLWVPGVGHVYCINPGFATGFNNDPETVSSYNRTYTHNSGGLGGQTSTADITPREAFEISWIIATYGQLDLPQGGGDNEQKEWAAATEVAVWQRSVPVVGGGVPVQQWFQARWAGHPGVDAKIAQINAAVAGQNPSASGGGSGSITINMTNYVEGEAVVSMSPADAVATLTITGGTFPGGMTSIGGVTNGQRIPITGDASVDPENPEKQYDIQVTGSAVGTGSGFGEQFQVLRSGGQDTARPATAVPVNFDLSAGVADPLIEFSPVVTTQAPEFVQQGENFADVLTANIANAEDPASGPWATFDDGSYVPVNAKGTLYGPMLSIPEESAEAPSWAPIAGTAEATLNGPGDYTVNTDFTSQEAGYYTWVWEIDRADQGVVATMLLPEGYHFRDNFAQVVETSVTPSGIVATSQVPEEEVAITDPISDTLSVSTSASSGGWIQANRQRIPVVFRGTAYFVPGDEAPTLSDTAPEGAEVVGTTTLTATGPGQYTSEELVAPAREGYVSWVWEIREEDQPEEFRGYVRPWADQFGIPAETVRVEGPDVGTQAQTNVPVGDTFHDVATVSGRIPQSGVDLSFELYEATKDEEGNWVCGEGNLLWTSSSQRVTEPGDYTSEEAPFQPVGEYHWVEVIRTPDGEEVSRGICGLPNETTTVVEPEVTTKAQPASSLGGEIFDVATVTGPVAKNGYDLTFEAYKVPTDAEGNIVYPEGFTPSDEEGANNLTWVCEDEPVFTTEEAIKVTEAGEFQSESFTPTEYGKYLWVETLTYNPTEEQGGESIEVHRGECGVRLETSFIVDVTTKAQERGKAGETATDTAIVDGFVPDGATITFDAYKVPKDAPQAPTDVCTEGTLIGSTKPVEIAGGMHDGTEIVSAPIDLPLSPGEDYKVYWIETTHDELGNVIAQGECGLPEETTIVEGSEAELAWTGGESNTALWVGGAALLALMAGAGVYTLRRRQEV